MPLNLQSFCLSLPSAGIIGTRQRRSLPNATHAILILSSADLLGGDWANTHCPSRSLAWRHPSPSSPVPRLCRGCLVSVKYKGTFVPLFTTPVSFENKARHSLGGTGLAFGWPVMDLCKSAGRWEGHAPWGTPRRPEWKPGLSRESGEGVTPP